MNWTPSVGTSGDKRTVNVEVSCGDNLLSFTLDYDRARELRDMITDGLDHIDECDRQKNPPVTLAAAAGWDTYLVSRRWNG